MMIGCIDYNEPLQEMGVSYHSPEEGWLLWLDARIGSLPKRFGKQHRLFVRWGGPARLLLLAYAIHRYVSFTGAEGRMCLCTALLDIFWAP
jgi:hypothetical protein